METTKRIHAYEPSFDRHCRPTLSSDMGLDPIPIHVVDCLNYGPTIQGHRLQPLLEIPD